MDKTVSLFDIVVGGSVIIGLIISAITLFVTRFEHRDSLSRISRLEAWQDRMTTNEDQN